MTDSNSKKPGTLKLSPKPTNPSDKTSGKSGTGARAHRKAQSAVQQQKLQERQQRQAHATQKPLSRTQRPSSEHRPRANRSDAPGANPLADLTTVHRAFASCPRGLEAVLHDELILIGLRDVQQAPAGCRFRGTWMDVWRANLHSRIATRILLQLAYAPVQQESDIRDLAMQTPWETWLGPEKTLRVDTSAIRSPMKSLQYCNLLVKDAICDRLRDVEGARPSIDTVRPDTRVHLFLSEDAATLYLDTSGESLFKRGWRFDKAAAPIRENLAAGMLALAGWTPDQPLLDPFCGSGTILIEAAWIAKNIPPGINRPFAFERLRGHDRDAWQAMRREATDAIRSDAQCQLFGVDLSEAALNAAHQNTKRAGLGDDCINWVTGDACTFASPAPSGLIVTNPPYGERLALEAELMQRWATQLKRQFAGWQAFVISADHGLSGAMRLKASRRTPLFNGALDCRLFRFDLVAAQYRT